MLTTHRHGATLYLCNFVQGVLELIILCDFKIMGAQTVSHINLPPVSEVEDVSGWL